MNNDFINFFGGILNSTKVEGKADFSDERELDRFWQEYNDYILKKMNEYRYIDYENGYIEVITDITKLKK